MNNNFEVRGDSAFKVENLSTRGLPMFAPRFDIDTVSSITTQTQKRQTRNSPARNQPSTGYPPSTFSLRAA